MSKEEKKVGESEDSSVESEMNEEKDKKDEKKENSDDFVRKYVICLVIFMGIVLLISIIAVAAGLVFYYYESQGPPPFEFPESVVNIDASNFGTVINDDENAFVLFYAPWCGHCKKAKDDFAKLADIFSEERNDSEYKVTVAALNCDANNALCKESKVQGFPTFKLFKKGKVKDYQGSRKAEDFDSFIRLSLGPSIFPFTSLEGVESLFEKFPKKTIVLGTFEKSEKEEIVDYYNVYQQLADDCDDMIFAELFVSDEKSRGFTVFPYWDRKDKKSAAPSKDIKFLEEELKFLSFPLIEEFSEKSFHRSKMEKKPIFVMFIGEEQFWLKTVIEELAMQGRRSFIPTFGSAEKYRVQLAMSFGHLEFPAAIVFHKKKNFVFQNEDVTVDGLSSWMDNILKGKEREFYKSEKVPVKGSEDEYYVPGIKKIVGRSIENYALENSKIPVLIGFGRNEMIDSKFIPFLPIIKKDLGLGEDKLIVGCFSTSDNILPPFVAMRATSSVPKLFLIRYSETVMNEGKKSEEFVFSNEDLTKLYLDFTAKFEELKESGSETEEFAEKTEFMNKINEFLELKQIEEEIEKEEVKEEEIKKPEVGEEL